MGLMDKVKAQATTVAQKAQEGVKAGQDKLDDVQTKRRVDGLLRDLGAQVFAEKSGKATAATSAEIVRLVAELTALENETGPIGAEPTTPAVGGAGQATESASYNLDDI